MPIIPDTAWPLLDHIHRRGLGVSGDLARAVATNLGLLASLGWISTLTPDHTAFANRWQITTAGLSALTNKDILCS